MAEDDLIILNQGWEFKSTKSGKQRVVLRVVAEPLAVNCDPKALGRPVAQAIVHHLREKIANVAALAAPATIKYRKVAARAYAKGKPWALKRFSGGRLGATPPTGNDHALNGSGRLAKSITGNASSDGSWRFNIAANRSDPSTGNIERIMAKITEYVPELVNPALLLGNDIIRAAIQRAVDGMITKGPPSSRVFDVLRAGLELVRTAGDVIEGVIGE